MPADTLQLFPALPAAIEAALRASIQRFGVLLPVVHDQHGRLLDGYHRSRLAKELGVSYRVDVVAVRDDAEARESAYTLNTDRRQLTPEQRQEVAVALRQEGHSLRAIGGALGVSEGQIRKDLSHEELRTGTQLTPAIIHGLDGKARRLPTVAAKTPQEAERAQAALLQLGTAAPGTVMDVKHVERVAKASQAADFRAHPLPIPDGQYRCIVIDPPWPMEKIERDVRPHQGPVLDYPTMAIWCPARQAAPYHPDCGTIECLVGGLLAAHAVPDGCHVYLWVTHRFLPDGLALLATWGVRYECHLTWGKDRGMTPYSWMYDTEDVLFGRLGHLQLEQNGLRLLFTAPAQGHSVKPAVFYERVCQASPGPRLDLFARQDHAGFVTWGTGPPTRAAG